MSKKHFSVREFADYTGLTIRTLHYYDEKEILVPERNELTGHRQYVREDILRLHQILTLKYLGFTLEEIKELTTSSSVDLSFIETLRLQEAKLLEDKERIEVSLEMIQRTVRLMEDEKEIERDLLVSLLSSMQTEKQQKEISKGIITEQALERLFQATKNEKMIWEKELLHFYKETKRLVGKPSNHPEVNGMIQRFYSHLLEIFNLENVQDLKMILKQNNPEEIDEEELQRFVTEMEKLVPSPLTKEEEQWLDDIFEVYIEENDDMWKGKEANGRKAKQ